MADVVELSAATLAACERVIESGMTAYAEVGAALARIRDEKLYGAEYATFVGYCKGRWNMTSARATQLIQASAVALTLVNERMPAPATEAHCRPLVRLSAEEQPKAWAEALESAPRGRVTKSHVTDVVRGREARSIPEEIAVPDAEELRPNLRLVKEPDKTEKPLTKRGAARVAFDEKVRELHGQGLAPHEIASELGAKIHRVNHSKGRQGLTRRKSPLQGLIDSAIEGTDTWQDALTQTAEQWSGASPEELAELIARLEELSVSAKAMIRALKKHADRRTV